MEPKIIYTSVSYFDETRSFKDEYFQFQIGDTIVDVSFDLDLTVNEFVDKGDYWTPDYTHTEKDIYIDITSITIEEEEFIKCDSIVINGEKYTKDVFQKLINDYVEEN